MHRPGLRFDVTAPRKIDADGAEEWPASGAIPPHHYVYRTDPRFVWRDGGEEAVLGIRALLVVDWSVGT